MVMSLVHVAHADIAALVWRRRMRNHETRSHYLQEVSAQTFAGQMPAPTRFRIRSSSESFAAVLRLCGQTLRKHDCRPMSQLVPSNHPTDRRCQR